MTKITTARPVDSIAEITEPGDYWHDKDGSYTGKSPSVFFMLPNAKPVGPAHRGLHHVCAPPHVIRECSDGSLEIRESIGASRIPDLDGPGDGFIWHGYMDEGFVWREI